MPTVKSEEVTAVGAPIRSHISDCAETGPAEPSAKADSPAPEPRPSNPEPRSAAPEVGARRWLREHGSSA
jgi:hypothetical protein